MIVDERKDLQFDYNFLNLLSRAVANSDTTDVKTVYRWLADGTKLGVSDASGDNGYEYLGSLIYRKTPSGTELESTGFRQGRFVNASGGIQIRYHLTDHLGSIRTIIDETGAVVATNDYYTFGKRWDDPQSLNASSNRWLYNGKEIQETGSLDLLDYGARMYDPYIGRWLTQDPLAEVFPWESPFSYAFNNPIKLIDMFGLAPKKPDNQQDEIDGDTLPEVVVTAPRDNPWIEWLSLRPELEFAPMDADDYPDLSLSILEIGITAGYSRMNSLAKNGQFLGWHNGQFRLYSSKYYGNQYMPAATVTAQKANFARTFKTLKNLKGIFTVLGVADGITQTENLINKLKSGEDIDPNKVYELVSTVIGLCGVPGAIISGIMDLEMAKIEAIEKTFGSYEKFREIDMYIPDF